MLKQRDLSPRKWLASGEPWIWMTAAAVGISITVVLGVLLLIAVRGSVHFWPSEVLHIDYVDEAGRPLQILGNLADLETLPASQFLESTGAPVESLPAGTETVQRWLIKKGNRRVNPPDFVWIAEHRITAVTSPEDALVLERTEWGNAYGFLVEVLRDGEVVASGESAWTAFEESQARANELRTVIHDIERGEFNSVNYAFEQLRLDRRGLELSGDTLTAAQAEALAIQEAELQARYATAEAELRESVQLLSRDAIRLRLVDGSLMVVPLAEIVRAWQPNRMTGWQQAQHYGRSLWLFLSEQPREANTEGGIFPAIFGTVMMVMLMAVLVAPLGVIAAVYLREYAKQGPLVRLIRIAVNNLAGVPSIVYGVFGLGFFVYFIGGSLDELFYPETLPAPTFGTPGLLWASLTLALLTLPVVVVSTEEGLTRIPRSLREGSLALGATQAETLFKVALPMASPSILTGVILAVARAAGEVAPLMLVGVVKLAPTLPVDGNFPFVHLERKFMHLGFHIYDVGFQSPNVDAARPLVFATALLLVIIIVFLNLSAILLRNRLEDRFKGVES